MRSGYGTCRHCSESTMLQHLKEGCCRRCLWLKPINDREKPIIADQINPNAAAQGNIMMMDRMIAMMPDDDPQKKILQEMFIGLMSRKVSNAQV